MLELEGLLEQAALQNPLLVCLDDMHWADGGTVEALRVLPARLASVPIVWIAAFRGRSPTPPSPSCSGSSIPKRPAAATASAVASALGMPPGRRSAVRSSVPPTRIAAFRRPTTRSTRPQRARKVP
jgi:hypothetical protein